MCEHACAWCATLMSLSMPPEMIWSLVSLKVTLRTWYVFWNVWTDAFFLMSHSYKTRNNRFFTKHLLNSRQTIQCNYHQTIKFHWFDYAWHTHCHNVNSILHLVTFASKVLSGVFCAQNSKILHPPHPTPHIVVLPTHFFLSYYYLHLPMLPYPDRKKQKTMHFLIDTGQHSSLDKITALLCIRVPFHLFLAKNTPNTAIENKGILLRVKVELIRPFLLLRWLQHWDFKKRTPEMLETLIRYTWESSDFFLLFRRCQIC